MPTKINVRSVYYPHLPVRQEPGGPSLTQQNFRDETDVNNILAKYKKTGLIDHINKYGGQYADMPAEGDFHEAMTLVANAQSMFAELPAFIRAEFENDPARFLDFVDNPATREAAIEMGLYPQEPPETPPEGEPTLPGTPPPELPPASPDGLPGAEPGPE